MNNLIFVVVVFLFTLFIVGFSEANINIIQKLNPDLELDYVIELDKAFDTASSKYNIDKSLLIAMAYHESTFKSGVKGDNDKSWGIMQVGKQGRRACGYSDTVEGQILSGACWLNEGRKWCKSLEGGLYAYACGSCVPTGYRCKQAVKRRLELSRRVKK